MLPRTSSSVTESPPLPEESAAAKPGPVQTSDPRAAMAATLAASKGPHLYDVGKYKDWQKGVAVC